MHRGELYPCACEFPALCDILEQWTARPAGQARFDSRRLESAPWAERLLARDLYPRPDRASLKACMLSAIELQLELRNEIVMDTACRTTQASIDKVTRLVQSLWFRPMPSTQE